MEHQNMNERRWHLAMKVLTDGLDAEEAVEWNKFLEDGEFSAQFKILEHRWNEVGELPYHAINVEKDWSIVARRAGITDPKRKIVSPVWRYAAAILLLLTAWLFVNKSWTSKEQALMATLIEAPNGARTSITLPDSSKVWLNSGSRISFESGFGLTHRNIKLEGEAFFDVEKSRTPFIVQTSDFNATVLGTTFNISAYAGDDVGSATLVHGSLRITRGPDENPSEEIVLKPNQKAIIYKNNSGKATQRMVLEDNVDALADVEWKDGWLTVRGESLAALSKKIERVYNVKVKFEDETLKSFRYNGRIQQLSLEQVLQALALTSPVKFKISGKEVVFSENEITKAKYETNQ